MEIRFVRWKDSIGSHGWEPLEETQTMRPMEILTVGFVSDEGDDYVTITQSYDERANGRHQVDHSICIPKFAIVESRTVEGG